MMRHLAAGLLAVLWLASGCSKRDERPVAGLLAAGAPVLRLERKKEKKPVAVGAHLRPGDRLEATGPAVLEYFGGGLRFLEEGDTLEVGEAEEAKLLGLNLPSRRWVDGAIQEAPPAQPIVAARYTNVEVTPASSLESEPGTGDYLRAFFSPDGMDSLGAGPRSDGPSRPLPPPPHRARVPFIHAGPLGEGGMVAQVEDGFVVAETDDLATAVLREGKAIPLGRTVRLLVPRGSEVTLRSPGGSAVELSGPAELRFR